MHHFDLIVSGSGPGGQRAATQAAKLGKRVAICEQQREIGGVCINTGITATLRATSLRKRTVRAEPHTRAVRYRTDRGLARADARQIAAVLTCAELLGFGASLAI